MGGWEGESLKVKNAQIRGENYLLGEICAIITIGSRRLGVQKGMVGLPNSLMHGQGD
jgi:hypothetical protein